MSIANDLSLVDIEFLRAVEELNKNPENYRDTDKGQYPANTTSIRKHTELTQEKVKYRMGGNKNTRGFEIETDERPQMILSHDAPVSEKGFGARSVELTTQGQEILKQAEEVVSRITSVTREINKVEGEKSNHLRAKIMKNEIINTIEYDLTGNGKNEYNVNIEIDANPLLIVYQTEKSPRRFTALWQDQDVLKVLHYNRDNDCVEDEAFDISADPATIAEEMCNHALVG